MSEIRIPAAALEAGARAAHDQWRHQCADESDEPVENWQEWDDIDEWEQDSFRAQARAAIAAALNAWPGMRLGKYRDVAGSFDRIILPLTQEASDE